MQFFGNQLGCQTKRHDPISVSRYLVLLEAQELNVLFLYYLCAFFCVAVINMFVRFGLTGIHSAVAQEMEHVARNKLTEYIASVHTSQLIQ